MSKFEKGTSLAHNTVASTAVAAQFALSDGDIVQEFGYDDDADETLRAALESIIGSPLEDEDYRGAADAVIAWWRSDDGDVDDLTDYLVDCASSLESGSGVIWCVIPSLMSAYHVSAADVNEAAHTAGLSATTTLVVSEQWVAVKITSRGR